MTTQDPNYVDEMLEKSRIHFDSAVGDHTVIESMSNGEGVEVVLFQKEKGPDGYPVDLDKAFGVYTKFTNAKPGVSKCATCQDVEPEGVSTIEVADVNVSKEKAREYYAVLAR